MLAHALALGTLLPHVAPALSGGVTELGAISVSVERDETTPPVAPSPPPEPPPAVAQAVPEPSTEPQEPRLDVPVTVAVVIPTGDLDDARLRSPPTIDAPPPAPPPAPSSLAPSTAAPAVEAMASRGEIEQFARGVALAISAKRPKGIGQKGRVEVELKLSLTGHIDVVRIAKSSGSARLDAIATTTIERASYPVPPAGLRPADLTFRVPFAFE